jgi:hypothetical protein
MGELADVDRVANRQHKHWRRHRQHESEVSAPMAPQSPDEEQGLAGHGLQISQPNYLQAFCRTARISHKIGEKGIYVDKRSQQARYKVKKTLSA